MATDKKITELNTLTNLDNLDVLTAVDVSENLAVQITKANLQASLGIDSHISNSAVHRTINDVGIGVNDLWSASKITTELASKSDSSSLTTHTEDSTIHFTKSQITITESQISDLSHNAVSIQGVTVDDTNKADGKILKFNATSGNLEYEDDTGTSAVWGAITGTLSSQTDLQNALNAKANTSSLSTVATSGDYSDLINKPTIVTSHTGLTNIGVNTHVQIDSHISNSTNPHTVTASQVGNSTAQWNANQIQGIDISATSPTDGKIWVYRTATSSWTLEDKPASGSNPALNDVSDVNITSVSDGQILTYDSGSGNWINSNNSGGYTDEQAQDAIGTILTDSSEIDFTYNDATPSITASIVAGSIDETKLDTSVNASLDLADSALQNITGENIESLSNVTITTVGDNEILSYDTTTSKWINQTITELGFATVATSGSYNDLTNKPTLITSHTALSNIGTNTHVQIDSHISNVSNPHTVTKTQVGLGSVENTALSTWAGTFSITTVGTLTSGNADSIVDIDNIVPTQTGNSGKYLTTNGTSVSWATVSSGGITWNEVTGTTQTASVNNGYITNNTGRVTVTLPATASVGDVVKVAGKGSGGWEISQNTGQTISFLNETTTPGTGTITSSNAKDILEMLCTTANSGWIVINAITQGSLTLT